MWLVWPEVGPVYLLKGDVCIGHPHLQLLLRVGDEERREVDPDSVDTVRFSQTNQELTLSASDVDYTGALWKPQETNKARQLLPTRGIAQHVLPMRDFVELPPVHGAYLCLPNG